MNTSAMRSLDQNTMSQKATHILLPDRTNRSHQLWRMASAHQPIACKANPGAPMNGMETYEKFRERRRWNYGIFVVS